MTLFDGQVGQFFYDKKLRRNATVSPAIYRNANKKIGCDINSLVGG
ncbi:MAG: hypothetical protein LBP59_09220 [Planctomycetaceae bacterium]|nr:hypothetical protein [Planctomycetaceae bacterium]